MTVAGKSLLVILLVTVTMLVHAEDAGHWQCLTGIVVDTAKRPEIITAVRFYNKVPPDPHHMDLIWPSLSRNDPQVRDITHNKVSPLLRHVIQSVSRQGEAMLMGANGGLVATIDKSSDFWQGDEDQFLSVIGLRDGQVHVESDVSDESTASIQVRISTPVFDPATHKAIGVLMLGFDSFVLDYLRTCDDSR